MECYDLKMIKDKYGEKMMHLCRESFPTLLDTPGLLYSLISNSFASSKYLYDDLVRSYQVEQFIRYISSKYKERYKGVYTGKSPQELLREAGYTLYECHTYSELDSFRKYYQKKEELCTFGVDRLKTHHVFFIVKDNVDEIKREDFSNPEREDEYSTSVLSIQFTKGLYNRLSIKSRYNHTVTNPDATHYNNLDNIVPGLTKSFSEYYKLNINSTYKQDFNLANYTQARDGRYYRYNYFINNTYYCPDNIIISNEYVIDSYMEKEKYLLIDYFIVDFGNKAIYPFEDINDSFPESVGEITKIEVYNDKKDNIKYLFITAVENEILIGVNKFNQIILYYNDYNYKIGDNFLILNETVEEVSLPNTRKLGKYFLFYNKKLNKLYGPNITSIGEDSLLLCRNASEIELPKYYDKDFILRRKKVKYD